MEGTAGKSNFKLKYIGVRGPRTGLCCSWVREGKGPGQDPRCHESSPSPPPGVREGRKNLSFTNGSSNDQQKMLGAAFCTEFRCGAQPSSEIIEMSTKMKVLVEEPSLQKLRRQHKNPGPAGAPSWLKKSFWPKKVKPDPEKVIWSPRRQSGP